MKYIVILLTVLSFSTIAVFADCTYCNVPDAWTCINDGGQELFDGNGDCYRGFLNVEIDEESKTANCHGERHNKCTVPSQYWGFVLHNALIERANKKIHEDNILTGSDNINMYINGFPRYGSVTWSTNSTTGQYLINTLIN